MPVGIRATHLEAGVFGDALATPDSEVTGRLQSDARDAPQSAPDELTPCLVLTHPVAWRAPRSDTGSRAGIYYFGNGFMDAEPGRPPDESPYVGVILPLSSCRNPQLQQNLLEFTRLVFRPMATDRPPSGRGSTSRRRKELQAWLNERRLDGLKLQDKEPIRQWVRFERFFCGLPRRVEPLRLRHHRLQCKERFDSHSGPRSLPIQISPEAVGLGRPGYAP